MQHAKKAIKDTIRNLESNVEYSETEYANIKKRAEESKAQIEELKEVLLRLENESNCKSDRPAGY